MTNIRLNRDHNGKLHLRVGAEYAIGAEVSSIVGQGQGGELVAVVTIPMKHVVLGEIDNVVPLVRPVAIETR